MLATEDSGSGSGQFGGGHGGDDDGVVVGAAVALRFFFVGNDGNGGGGRWSGFGVGCWKRRGMGRCEEGFRSGYGPRGLSWGWFGGWAECGTRRSGRRRRLRFGNRRRGGRWRNIFWRRR